MKKVLTLFLIWLAACTGALAQGTITLPIPANTAADLGNGPLNVRIVQGNASIFTAQGSGVGSTSGSSTALTLTTTPATAPLVGALISGTGIASGTKISAYNGTTGVTLSAAMTVPAATTVSWGAACPASAAGIPAHYIVASISAGYYLMDTQARICAVSPGSPVNTLLILPVFYDSTTGSGGSGVSSVSNSDGTLTISPNTGAVAASLNLAHVNVWTAANTTFNGLTLSNVTGSTQCLQVNSSGIMSGSGGACGGGGGSGITVGTTTIASGTTGRVLFDNAGVLGEYTITGTAGSVVMSAAPAIVGGSHTALTSLGIRDTSAAFDVTLAAVSSTPLTAGRTLTVDMVNAARTLKLGANLTLASDPGAVTGALKSNGSGTFAQAACADLAVACLTVNQTITLSGDATGSGTTAITVVNANLPTGVTVAGNLLHTNIAAPSTPASGKDIIWTDSTDLRFHDKNASGTIGTTVVADTGASNNFLTAISAAGVVSKAQPSFSNISGTIATGQVSGSYTGITGVGTLTAGALGSGFTAVALAQGGTGQVTALAARSSSGLNIDESTSVGDTNGTIAATDRGYYHTALSAARTDTLPAANAVNNGQVLWIQDFRGVATASNTVTVTRAGSDTVNGSTSFTAISAAFGISACWSDGSTRWNCQPFSGGGGGGVTSVTITAGAGISVSGTCPSAITSAGTCAIAQQAPAVASCASGLTCDGAEHTYPVPANTGYLIIRMSGGGSGGGGGNNASTSTAGGDTCLKATATACTSPIIKAAGAAGSTNGGAGAGGAVTNCNMVAVTGGTGTGNSQSASGSLSSAGGFGAPGPFGGGGAGANSGAGTAAPANSGAGGGGGGDNSSVTSVPGFGGSAGGNCMHLITSPGASYTYIAGLGGAGASGGTNGFAGAAGGNGNLVIEAH